MTPVETGVREYCANTREKVAVAILIGVKSAAAWYWLTLDITLANSLTTG